MMGGMGGMPAFNPEGAADEPEEEDDGGLQGSRVPGLNLVMACCACSHSGTFRFVWIHLGSVQQGVERATHLCWLASDSSPSASLVD